MTKRPLPSFIWKRVQLRLLREADLPMTLLWRNKERVRTAFLSSDPLTPSGHRDWFARYSANDTEFVFVAETLPPSSRPFGQVSIYDIDRLQATGRFGRFLLGEDDVLGSGIGFETAEAACVLARDLLQLRTLHLEVFDWNERALSIYRALGFQVTSRRDKLAFMTLPISQEIHSERTRR
jgi:RimJ/RimL family protein N-acetyltransferase